MLGLSLEFQTESGRLGTLRMPPEVNTRAAGRRNGSWQSLVQGKTKRGELPVHTHPKERGVAGVSSSQQQMVDEKDKPFTSEVEGWNDQEEGKWLTAQ